MLVTLVFLTKPPTRHRKHAFCCCADENVVFVLSLVPYYFALVWDLFWLLH